SNLPCGHHSPAGLLSSYCKSLHSYPQSLRLFGQKRASIIDYFSIFSFLPIEPHPSHPSVVQLPLPFPVLRLPEASLRAFEDNNLGCLVHAMISLESQLCRSLHKPLHFHFSGPGKQIWGGRSRPIIDRRCTVSIEKSIPFPIRTLPGGSEP